MANMLSSIGKKGRIKAAKWKSLWLIAYFLQWGSRSLHYSQRPQRSRVPADLVVERPEGLEM